MTMHLYLVFGVSALVMNIIGALWFGPLLGPRWLPLMNAEKNRRFERWANQYSFRLAFVLSSFSNVFYIAMAHHVLKFLDLLHVSQIKKALMVVTMFHTTASLSSMEQGIWTHRPWRLILIEVLGHVVSSYAGTIAMLYLIKLAL